LFRSRLIPSPGPKRRPASGTAQRTCRAGRSGEPRGRHARQVRCAVPEAGRRFGPGDGMNREVFPEEKAMPFDRVEDAIEDIRQGKLVIIADDEDRENEGDLVCAAAKITPELVNFMATHGRGLICVALTPERAHELDLPLMTEQNQDAFATAFTVSVDAHPRFGVTTGISASDRAKTIELLADPNTRPGDLRRPGHV